MIWPGNAAGRYFLAPVLVHRDKHLDKGRAELHRADLEENLHDSTSLPKRFGLNPPDHLPTVISCHFTPIKQRQNACQCEAYILCTPSTYHPLRGPRGRNPPLLGPLGPFQPSPYPPPGPVGTPPISSSPPPIGIGARCLPRISLGKASYALRI